MRNRGSRVNTLTSGPGMVFTIKDVNETLSSFCRGLIKYGERELKSRSDLMYQQVSHLMGQLYIKDQKIAILEQRAEN